ncbi:hypothetical protein ACFL0V_06300 [Nanoarchaeota archaeon]
MNSEDCLQAVKLEKLASSRMNHVRGIAGIVGAFILGGITAKSGLLTYDHFEAANYFVGAVSGAVSVSFFLMGGIAARIGVTSLIRQPGTVTYEGGYPEVPSAYQAEEFPVSPEDSYHSDLEGLVLLNHVQVENAEVCRIPLDTRDHLADAQRHIRYEVRMDLVKGQPFSAVYNTFSGKYARALVKLDDIGEIYVLLDADNNNEILDWGPAK